MAHTLTPHGQPPKEIPALLKPRRVDPKLSIPNALASAPTDPDHETKHHARLREAAVALGGQNHPHRLGAGVDVPRGPDLRRGRHAVHAQPPKE